MYTTIRVGNFYNISSRHRHLKYTKKRKNSMPIDNNCAYGYMAVNSNMCM